MPNDRVLTMIQLLRTSCKDLLVAGELLQENSYIRNGAPEDYQAVWRDAAEQARDVLDTLDHAITRAREKA